MPNVTKNAKVSRAQISREKEADAIVKAEQICAAGAQSQKVQGSAIVKPALDALQTNVKQGRQFLNQKVQLAQALALATKSFGNSFGKIVSSLATYETSVEDLAGGDAAVIVDAGCTPRDTTSPTSTLGMVTDAAGGLGKMPAQTILTWSKVSGATHYAIEINMTPATPAGPWTALPTGSRRRRVITSPAPGMQMLVRVAAVASDGTQSPWSSPILVTTSV
jgi:hypothetical protein